MRNYVLFPPIFVSWELGVVFVDLKLVNIQYLAYGKTLGTISQQRRVEEKGRGGEGMGTNRKVFIRKDDY